MYKLLCKKFSSPFLFVALFVFAITTVKLTRRLSSKKDTNDQRKTISEFVNVKSKSDFFEFKF